MLLKRLYAGAVPLAAKSDPSISEKTVQWAAVTGKIPQDFWGGNRLGETAFIVKGGFYEFCDIR